MNVLYLTMIISGLMGAGFVALFIWSAKNGQFDELDSSAITILNDDEPLKRKEKDE